MPQFPLLFQRLSDAGLDFVVIGGFAGVLHGSAYVTDDLDICAVVSPENLAKLRQALGDLNPVHRITANRLSFIDHPSEGQSVANLYLSTDAGVLDVLGDVLGLGSYDDIANNAMELDLYGRTCRVLSMGDLIKAKEAAGREKDLLVAKELRAIAAKKGIALE